MLDADEASRRDRVELSGSGGGSIIHFADCNKADSSCACLTGARMSRYLQDKARRLSESLLICHMISHLTSSDRIRSEENRPQNTGITQRDCLKINNVEPL
jgi:hypothetical protein